MHCKGERFIHGYSLPFLEQYYMYTVRPGCSSKHFYLFWTLSELPMRWRNSRTTPRVLTVVYSKLHTRIWSSRMAHRPISPIVKRAITRDGSEIRASLSLPVFNPCYGISLVLCSFLLLSVDALFSESAARISFHHGEAVPHKQNSLRTWQMVVPGYQTRTLQTQF